MSQLHCFQREGAELLFYNLRRRSRSPPSTFNIYIILFRGSVHTVIRVASFLDGKNFVLIVSYS